MYWELDEATWDWITAGIILGCCILASILVGMLWRQLFIPAARRLGIDPSHSALSAFRSLARNGLILAGFYYGISSLDGVAANEKYQSYVDRANSVLWAILIVQTIFRVFNLAVEGYAQRAASRTEGMNDVTYQALLIRKVGNIILLAIGLLSILHVGGIDISPLLASGAIGGLAIALAAQDTFSNLIAGFFLTMDKPVRVGDFIKLESGEEGYVQEIGWRNTRVRLLRNNMVIIPNSKLNQSVVTNYYMPEPELSVIIGCSVSYDSDLPRVEAIAIEVGREVLQKVEGAVADWEPLVRWTQFGDSGINFNTVLRAHEYGNQFLLQSEFIKALHARFSQDEIEIPYPIQTVVIKSEKPAEETAGNGRRDGVHN